MLRMQQQCGRQPRDYLLPHVAATKAAACLLLCVLRIGSSAAAAYLASMHTVAANLSTCLLLCVAACCRAAVVLQDEGG